MRHSRIAGIKTVGIVNPTSGARKARRMWPALLEALGPRGAAIETWWTERPGHAELLAAAARRAGYGRVIAAGGDGTLFEVINGLWWEPEGKMPEVGMVPFGTGRDYVRNFELGKGLLDKLVCAAGGSVIPVSLGECRLTGPDGQPRQRVFAMALGAGLDAGVITRFRSRRLIRRGWAAYALSALRELWEMKPCRFEGEINGEPFTGRGPLFVAALGKYFGRAMMIAPGASPALEAFQVIRGEGFGGLTAARLVLEAYFGRHVKHLRIESRFARKIVLRSNPPVCVEADGEPIGQTPLEVEIRPKAFAFAAKGLRRTG